VVPAPFEFVVDSADLLQVAVRMGDENPCAFAAVLDSIGDVRYGVMSETLGK
jgi:hypothetical protein